MDTLHNPNHKFSQAFDGLNVICVTRLGNPFWKLFRFLSIGPERYTKEYSQIIESFLHDVVTERKTTRETSGFQDVLLMFIEEYRKRGEKIDDRVLRDVAMTFTIAGRDTVGWTLTMLVYMLILHPEIEKNLIEEISRVLGEEQVTYENAPNLIYFQAFIYETLRLYPPVSSEGKFAVKADRFPDGTEILPGDGVDYSPWSQGRDPTIWDNPLVFDVSRWINSNGKFQSKNEYEFSAFNAGPRICLGKAMASFEIKILMVEILRKFRFEPVTPLLPMPVARFGTTLLFSSGLPMRVKSRN